MRINVLKPNINPERQINTAKESYRHRKKIALDIAQPIDMNESLLQNYVRPHTTALTRRSIYSTLNSSGRNTNMINLRSISVIENQLSDTFRQQLSPFLKNKFKSLVKKKHEQYLMHKSLNNTIENMQMTNSSRMSNRKQLDNYYSFINNDKVQVQRQVDEAHLITAKERITRLIQMKKQKESDYETLKAKISAKRNTIEQIKKKNRFNQFKKQTVQDESWDKNWMLTKKNEEKRYRNRLIMKCHKQNVPFFDIVI